MLKPAVDLDGGRINTVWLYERCIVSRTQHLRKHQSHARSTAPAPAALVAHPIFRFVVMATADRRWIDPAELLQALRHPIRRERQADGRIRYWAYIPRLGTYIRVITLADGETVHNVFKDRDFTE
jgi:hypothetical protein